MSWKGMRTMPEDLEDGSCPCCGVNPSTESDYGLCDCMPPGTPAFLASSRCRKTGAICAPERHKASATVVQAKPFTPDAEWLQAWASL